MSSSFWRGTAAPAVLFAFLAGTAHAGETYAPTTEYRDRIKAAQTIQPLGDTPFGESVNLYKGGLSFAQTDISYPGIGPTITLSRSYSIGGATSRALLLHAFLDWDLSIPRIETILPGDSLSTSTIGEWKTVAGGYSRCSGFGKVSPQPYNAFGMHWWNGYQLITPDGASQPLLDRDTEHNPIAPSSGTYDVVTARHWMLSCIPIDNPGSNGIQGEGFLALAPDGTTYRFDHLVYGPAVEELLYEAFQPIQHLPRKMGYLYVTKIEDRFGNSIIYHYDANGRADSITGSDGRVVAINRAAGNRISSIVVQPGSPAAQTWTYQYVSPGGTLSVVTLPDASKWSLAMHGADQWDMRSEPQGCGELGTVPDSVPETISITHPSGLVGTFDVDYHEFGRSKVPNVCYDGADSLPTNYLAIALDQKAISGPGVTEQTWTYTYGVNLSTDPNCAETGCVASSWVEVGAPDSSAIRYTHSAEWGPYEGKLLNIIAGKTTAVPAGLRQETHEYAATDMAPFPSHLGSDPGVDGTVNDGPVEYLAPETKVTTTLQGVSFVRTVNGFDQYANPTSITRASSGGAAGNFSKTETITYSHHLGEWVLSQPAVVTVGGVEVSNTLYDSATALPTSRKSFGLLQQTLAYDSNGMLSSVTDGRGKVTTLSQWYRGIPKLIHFPTAAEISAVVDEAGKITSITDELQNVTSYGYDAMGRLASITYPTGDTPVWNPLDRSMVLVTGDDGSGLPANHWTQTVQTRNSTGKTTTYYDARWLPVLTLTEDTANGASKSFVVQRFDGLGRLTFKSYPVGSATAASTPPGITTIYDALGRPVQVKEDSERGTLITATDYLEGFQTRVTSPNGPFTTTSYQVFDAPSTAAPVLIQAPEDVQTTITRDVFGAPLSITRSGPGN